MGGLSACDAQPMGQSYDVLLSVSVSLSIQLGSWFDVFRPPWDGSFLGYFDWEMI